jgi:hypothetical protein
MSERLLIVSNGCRSRRRSDDGDNFTSVEQPYEAGG